MATIQTLVRTVEVVSNQGRDGVVEASDRTLRFDLAAEGAPSPEHLFAAAYASCFHSALRAAAKTAGADITGTSVIARVSLGEDENGSYLLDIELRAAIPGVSRDAADKLLRQAHHSCPYSRALRGESAVRIATD